MELRNKSFPNEFQRAFYISKIYKGGLIQARPRMIADNADRMAVNHIRKKRGVQCYLVVLKTRTSDWNIIITISDHQVFITAFYIRACN